MFITPPRCDKGVITFKTRPHLKISGRNSGEMGGLISFTASLQTSIEFDEFIDAISFYKILEAYLYILNLWGQYNFEY